MATINNAANAASVGISSTTNKANAVNSGVNSAKNAAFLRANTAQNATTTALQGSATDILRRNLGLNPAKPQQAPILQSDELNLRLKSLVDKFLAEFASGGKFSHSALKEGSRLNFAPNFSVELKNLLSELQKNELFKEVAAKIHNALKPANALTPELLREGLKNSGLFLEARLKGLLNAQSLPNSLHQLLGALKSLNNGHLQDEIFALTNKEMDANESLGALKNVLQAQRQKALQSLENTPFVNTFKLLKNLENTAKHIAKNPLSVQNAVKSLAERTLGKIEQLLPGLQKELLKPQLLATNAPLNELGDSLNKLILILKSLANNGKIELSALQSAKNSANENSAKSVNLNENGLENGLKNGGSSGVLGGVSNGISSGISGEVSGGAKFVKYDENLDENSRLADKNSQNAQKTAAENSQNFKADEKNSQILDKNSQKMAENSQISQQISEKNSQNSRQINENSQNSQPLANPQPNALLENKNPTNAQVPETIKNLIFLDKATPLFDLEKLNQALANAVRKLNESLKSIDNSAFEANENLQEIKILEKFLSQTQKDFAKLAQKNELAEFDELKNDLKSTLLQTATLAKSANEDAVANQASRMLAQIELNQLLSIANADIITHLPFVWEDLKDSKLIFKRGKQGKYYARINLHFSKLGEIDILLALSHDKYLDINIMAESKALRGLIYEHSHELRRALNKAGLINSHFFVGDIPHHRHFDANFERNYDFEMGIDKHA